jgi:hypothetical protein
MNDIRLFSKLINEYAEETLEIATSPEQGVSEAENEGLEGLSGDGLPSKVIAKETLIKCKKRIEHIINELYSFDGRFREIIERKRTIRTLTAEEETALTEFSQKRSKLIADLKTELKKIEQHPLIKKPEISIEEKPSVSENASPVPVEVAKPSSSKNTTDTVEEKKEKKSKAPAKKETTKVDKEQEKREKLLAKEQEKEKARLAKEQARLAKEQAKRSTKPVAKATKPKIEK